MRLSLSFEGKLSDFSLGELRSIVRVTCREAFPRVFAQPIAVSLDIASVSAEEIEKLNSEYRGKKKPTDILSFGDVKSPQALSRFRGTKLDLGQLIICEPVIQADAKKDGVSWKHEATFVLSHGVLHLLGFDHSEKMFAIQDTVTESLMRTRRSPKNKNR